MITEILEYITNNRVIIVGAAGTICEVIVIIINLMRRIHRLEGMSYSLMGYKQSKFLKVLFWSANPLNLFRSVQ